ncbi:MAG TPA: POTRA domain-containing protein, partial [Myxococcota bacterium]|nr:POTRA domain-containing protein [Myxococcota bacterium]
MALSSVTDRLAPYRGQPVLAVDVQAPPGNDPDELRALIDIQPGYLLSQADVEAGIKRLYALGRFSQVEVFAERYSGVVLLHFVVHPLRRLGEVDVVGTRATSAAALRQALALNPGDEVDSRTEAELTRRALAHLRRVGYPQAQVQVARLSGADPAAVSYTLQVREGPPLRVGAVRFTGRPRVPAGVLGNILTTEPGGVLDLDVLQEDAARLRQGLIDRGFLRARVGPPEVQPRSDEAADVVLHVEAGERISIELTGNTLLSDASLRQLWPEASGAMTGTSRRLFEARIQNAYARQGYYEATVRTRAFRDTERGILRYLFIIHEGLPVWIEDIAFPGAQALPRAVLAEQVRALLRRELSDDTLFQALRAGDRPEG